MQELTFETILRLPQIHVYTITVRMLCRCNASAAKNFQGSASGAILILWRIGIIMQKKAKKRNHRFYG